MASAAALAVLALAVAMAPLVAHALGTDGNTVDLFGRLAGPSTAHPLGTDELGRDVLVRLLYGGRVSLLVALVTAVASSLVGTAVGITAGYYGGLVDRFLMRLTDTVICLPVLPLLIVFAAVDPIKLGLPPAVAASPSFALYRICAIVSLVSWTTVARLVRVTTASIGQRPFVAAARVLGASTPRILARHILPNLASPILVATTLSTGTVILVESVLSFLGLGIQPPTPSWGNLLTNAQQTLWEAPYLALYPGLLIFVTVICFNFLGDGLQDALDPRSHRQRP